MRSHVIRRTPALLVLGLVSGLVLVAGPARAQDSDPPGAVELDPVQPRPTFALPPPPPYVAPPPYTAPPPYIAPPPPPTSLQQLQPRRPWSGPWRPTLSFDLGGETGAGRSLLGLDLTVGGVAYERFLIEARISAHLDIARKPNPSGYLEQAENRILFGFETGYRLRLGGGKVPVHLVPRMGLLGAADVFIGKRAELGTGGKVLITEEKSTQWRTLPTLGVGLELGHLELVYRYHLDATDHRRSTHGLAAGFRF